MLDADARNVDVIFPYLNGEDLNSDPEQRPSRWVISFWDWPEERARAYKTPWAWIDERVRPERQRRDEDGKFVLRKPLPDRWWQYGDKRPGLYHAIGRGHHFEQHPEDWDPKGRRVQRVLACSLVSKYLGVAALPADWVYAHRLAVFATDSMAMFGLLTSSINDVWARKNSSSLETRLNYAPSDAFETLPLCDLADARLGEVGARYEARRRMLCRSLGVGLTDLYNRFHTTTEQASDLVALRELHQEVDLAVARAYGWTDLDLGHDFHSLSFLPENDRVRFTNSETARQQVLRRLGELNRQRYEEEHASAPVAKPRSPKGRKKVASAGQGALPLDVSPTPTTTSKTKAAAPAKKASTRRTSR
jgi:hypothetical protein